MRIVRSLSIAARCMLSWGLNAKAQRTDGSGAGRRCWTLRCSAGLDVFMEPRLRSKSREPRRLLQQRLRQQLVGYAASSLW